MIKICHLFVNNPHLSLKDVLVGSTTTTPTPSPPPTITFILIFQGVFGGCDPAMLSQFFVSSNPDSIAQLSSALCGLHNDEDIVYFLGTLHQNLDIHGLMLKGFDSLNQVFTHLFFEQMRLSDF